MKKLSKLLSVLMLVFPLLVSCGDDDDDPIISITSSGEIKGIVSGNSDIDILIDSVVCYVYSNDYEWNFGEYGLSSSSFKNGQFNFDLQTPPNSCLYAFLDVFGDVWDETTFTDISISDSTVKVTDYLYIDAYKEDDYVGYILRTNMTLEQSNSYDPKKGWASADYFYCDGNVKYTATEIGYSEEADKNLSYKYDLDMKKGWNEVIFQCSKVTDDMIEIKVSSNNEPSGMKWLFEAVTWEDYSLTLKSSRLHPFKSIWKKTPRK